MKKREVLKEGFIKGLKAALEIIQRQLNENWRDDTVDEIAQWFSGLKKGGVHLLVKGIFNSYGAGCGTFEEAIKSMSYDRASDILSIVVEDGVKISITQFMNAWEDAHLYYGESEGLNMEMAKGYINQRSITFNYLSILPQK